MTELQMGMIGLGVTAVVGVVAYNQWQEYRHRKLAERLLNGRHADVLIDEPEVGATGSGYVASEPEVEPEAPVTPTVASSLEIADNRAMRAPSNERIEPVLGKFLEPQEPAMARHEPSVEMEAKSVPAFEPASAPLQDEVMDTREVIEPFHLLSPIIDYVASFEAVEPASAYQILEAQRDVLARVKKPVHWIGYNELTREWETIIDDGESEYRRIRVGVQLVDRRGPLANGDLSVFHIAIQDLADELMAIADLPPRQPALEIAAKVDEFCASVDIQIGINVISQGQVFPGTKLRALAEAAGMVIDDEGRFVRHDDDGNVLYVLLNQEASGFSAEAMKTMTTHGLTFLLDVPCVAHGERVFNQMVDLAKRFADVLRGALVDDNRRPLSEGALEPIRLQVRHYQSLMAAQSLPAGGPLARRLFS
ncbi:cell division protein ZipA C-terminal FtsZ-binding domain-containing protein [Propionivibrio sp.]|uniref:cell division protein ZipA C-terminal FtsZ-binding domain-containing protein n=1 Tax=Propionivibrio sp. TaxID=2212460 RepID=UPI003BF410AC